MLQDHCIFCVVLSGAHTHQLFCGMKVCSTASKSMWGGASVFSIALAQARVGVGASSCGVLNYPVFTTGVFALVLFLHASLGARKQMGKGSWCCVCVSSLSLSA